MNTSADVFLALHHLLKTASYPQTIWVGKEKQSNALSLELRGGKLISKTLAGDTIWEMNLKLNSKHESQTLAISALSNMEKMLSEMRVFPNEDGYEVFALHINESIKLEGSENGVFNYSLPFTLHYVVNSI